jgi:hypothetical protein
MSALLMTDFQTCIFWLDRYRYHLLLGLTTDPTTPIPPGLMCQYSGIDDPQRYTKEELSSEEIERRIRNIIKVGRDEKLELKIPIYENGNCPEVSDSSFRHFYIIF